MSQHRVGAIGLRVAAVAGLAAAMATTARAGTSPAQWDPLAHFLIAAAVIVLLSHLLGSALAPLHQPPVVGEVMCGLVLGPSVLGATLPGLSHWLFNAATVSSLNIAAQLGLVTFMFLLGSEPRGSGERMRLLPVFVVAAVAMLVPFLGGAGIALGFHDLAGPAGGHAGYVLFLALAISVTALPVLARIVNDLKLTDLPVGRLALRSAAVGDGLAWIALSVLLAVLAATGVSGVLQRLGAAAALVLVAVLCVRPALAGMMRRTNSAGGNNLLLGMLLASALAGAGIAEAIGLHPAVGAFIFGVAVPRGHPVLQRATQGLQSFAITLLLPIFFTSIGLQVSVALLGTSMRVWGIFGAVLVVAFVTKLAGGYAGGRAAGLPHQDSLRLGTLMNCRGVTELIVASIGFQHRLINHLGLTMLVLVAVITTATTGPLLRLLADRPSSDKPGPSLVKQRDLALSDERGRDARRSKALTAAMVGGQFSAGRRVPGPK